VFERFTDRARQVVVLAQDEARRLGHNYIGTEHILLGLLREQEGLAAHVLESFDVTVEEVRAQVARIVGQGDEVTTGQIPFTPRTKKVLELALREGLSLGHSYIGTEHILLGIVRENEGVAARILLDFDADAEKVRNEVIRKLSGPGAAGEPPPFVPETPPLAPEVAEEVDRVRRDKQAALDAQDFERAARLRIREERLVRAAHALRAVWHDEPEPFAPLPSSPGVTYAWPPGPSRRSGRPWLLPLALGWGLAVSTGGLALFIGWLIWG
jgi:ATP-dependent Clp protease ATP-binding subunit ClpA